MNCPICGQQGLAEGTARCPRCGAELAAGSVYTMQSAAVAQKKPGKGKTVFLVILIVLLILEALFITAWFLDLVNVRKTVDGWTGMGKAAAAVEQPVAAVAAGVVA